MFTISLGTQRGGGGGGGGEGFCRARRETLMPRGEYKNVAVLLERLIKKLNEACLEGEA